MNIHTPNSLASVPATQILPFLYLGNYRDAESEEFFDTHNVKYVLNLTCNCPNYFSSRKDLSYKQVKIEDTCQENILKVIMEALDFIGESAFACLLNKDFGVILSVIMLLISCDFLESETQSIRRAIAITNQIKTNLKH